MLCVCVCQEIQGVSRGAGEGVCVSQRSSAVSACDRASPRRRGIIAAALRYRERRGQTTDRAAGRSGVSCPETQGHPHRRLRRGFVLAQERPIRHRQRRPAEDRESELRVCVCRTRLGVHPSVPPQIYNPQIRADSQLQQPISKQQADTRARRVNSTRPGA